MTLPDWIKADSWAMYWVEVCGMSTEQAVDASERLSIRVINGRIPEPHAVAEIEAAFWNRSVK